MSYCFDFEQQNTKLYEFHLEGEFSFHFFIRLFYTISYFVVQSRNNMTLIKHFFVNGKRPYTKMFYHNKRF
jgi:hypothetical protein